MTHILFGAPSDFSNRHPRMMLAAVLILIATSEWLVDALLWVVFP